MTIDELVITLARQAAADPITDPELHRAYMEGSYDEGPRVSSAIAALKPVLSELVAWRAVGDSVRELHGFGREWPAHGNVQLAVAASYSLLKTKADSRDTEVMMAMSKRMAKHRENMRERVEALIKSAEEASISHPEGSYTRDFYHTQGVAYENVLGLLRENG